MEGESRPVAAAAKGRRASARHWLRRRLLRGLVPPLYKAYMGLVLRTSRVETHGLDEFIARAEAGELALGAVWHQDIIAGGLFFAGRGTLTMVSRSADGDIGAEVIRRCGYVPVRGSSSKGGRQGLEEMIAYLNSHPGTIAGLTVDGPRGPAFRSKLGMIVLAREMRSPLFPFRVWAKRRWLLRSWDRTMIPPPFNHIVAWTGEPLEIPAETPDSDLERYRSELDRRLNELVERSLEVFP